MVSGVAFVCVAVFTAWAWAQQPPPEAETTPPSEHQAEAGPSPTTDPPRAEATPEDEPTTQPAPEAKPKAEPKKKRGKTPPFKMDPNAKWACGNVTSVHQPVWRGDKKLSFSFEIRNEGTADLKIKAKGG
jgi:hypothetical protein